MDPFFPEILLNKGESSSTVSKMRGAQMGVWKSRNPESGAGAGAGNGNGNGT